MIYSFAAILVLFILWIIFAIPDDIYTAGTVTAAGIGIIKVFWS